MWGNLTEGKCKVIVPALLKEIGHDATTGELITYIAEQHWEDLSAKDKKTVKRGGTYEAYYTRFLRNAAAHVKDVVGTFGDKIIIDKRFQTGKSAVWILRKGYGNK